MFDIKSFYEADSVEDAIAALTADPQSQVISGGTMDQNPYSIKNLPAPMGATSFCGHTQAVCS